jgi:hypothetical protein
VLKILSLIDNFNSANEGALGPCKVEESLQCLNLERTNDICVQRLSKQLEESGGEKAFAIADSLNITLLFIRQGTSGGIQIAITDESPKPDTIAFIHSGTVFIQVGGLLRSQPWTEPQCPKSVNTFMDPPPPRPPELRDRGDGENRSKVADSGHKEEEAGENRSKVADSGHKEEEADDVFRDCWAPPFHPEMEN